jgi:hypothetical protein
LDDTDGLREEFLSGAEAMGLVGRQKVLQPQQLVLADALNAGMKFTSVLMPRRSTKTTTLLAWIIGRCLSRPDYLAVYGVLTTQKKARDRFVKDIVPVLERVYAGRHMPFTIRTANGTERLTFDNGSIFQIAGPHGGDYRSDSYDLIVLDEAGEADPETGEDVLSAALPTMDTRPDAQLVIAGTAADYRTGNLLWDELELGRAGVPRHAIVDYSVDDEKDLDLSTWASVEPLVIASHPGVGRLTSIESIEDNYRVLGDRFPAEYLGIFGKVGTTSFLNVPKWSAQADTGALPSPPAHFRLAYTVHLLGRSASIVAAWRDKEGRACGLVLAHKAGSNWVSAEVKRLSTKYRVPVRYDAARGVDQVVAESLERMRPKPRLEKATWPEVSSAAVLLLKEIEDGNVVHWAQAPLDAAVAAATKRASAAAKRWTFGVSDEETEDVSPLSAWALALHAFDQAKVRQPLVIVS